MSYTTIGIKIVTPIITSMVGMSFYSLIFSSRVKINTSSTAGFLTQIPILLYPAIVGGFSGFSSGYIAMSAYYNGIDHNVIGNILVVVGSFIGFVMPLMRISRPHRDNIEASFTVIKSVVFTVTGALIGSTLRLFWNMFA